MGNERDGVVTDGSSATASRRRVTPRSAGFLEDLRSVSLRAIRLTWRDPEAFLPALVIPVFFFVVNVGALQKFVEGSFPAGLRLQGVPTSRRRRLRRHRRQPRQRRS